MLYPDEIRERVANGHRCGSQIGEGWFDLVRELDAKIAKLAPDYVVHQVKEKFGGLRYYIGLKNSETTISDKIHELVHETEQASLNICEVCGEEGKLISINGWYTTRCSKHEKKA